MDIMTALWETHLLWSHLAMTGYGSKCYAAKEVGLPHICDYPGECPCCKFDFYYGDDCASCPIWAFGDTCHSVGSPFKLWTHTKNDESRKHYAGEIADMAIENYNLLYSLGYRRGVHNENTA